MSPGGRCGNISGIAAEARAVGDVEILQREVAEAVGVVAVREQHRGDGRRIYLGVAAHHSSPQARTAWRSLGQAMVAREHVVEPFFVGIAMLREPVQHSASPAVGKKPILFHG